MAVMTGVRVLSALGVVALMAAQPALALDEQRLARFFALMDADGNGTISRPEFQAGKGAVFLAIDGDGSMTVTHEETRLTPEAFKALAGDDDVIDGEEFIAAEATAFDKIDTNQDKVIDPKELHDYVAKYSD